MSLSDRLKGATITSPLEPLRGEEKGLKEARQRIANKIMDALGWDTMLAPGPETRQLLWEKFEPLYHSMGLGLSESGKQALFQEVMEDLVGLGPLEPFLRDPSISDVLVNGPYQVYIERNGQIEETNARFANEEHLMSMVRRILDPLGRWVDKRVPMVDARLPDGSRVNVIIPPSSLMGPVVSIRKFPYRYTAEDLIRFGSITPEIIEFLKAGVFAKLNLLVSGGTGSGKTTLLNVLSSFIPEGERVVTIEDSAELQLHQRHVVGLEARPPEPDGTGEITIRDLVRNSLRMRPDRIVVGEVRGGEALDMLQAMNTGHEGSLTTIHSNSPRDALSRLETMVLMAGTDLPHRAIREQIASAIDIIIQIARLRDGSRRLVSLSEVVGMEGDIIVLQDIFIFEEAGVDGKGQVQGRHRATGIRPRAAARLEMKGFRLPAEIFGYEAVTGMRTRR